MPDVRFAIGITKLVPFLGFHHILMIFIALAIVLLCKLRHQHRWRAHSLQGHFADTGSFYSITTGRMLIIITTHTHHFPHILLLPDVRTDV